MLLDTHALLWFIYGDPKLSKRAREAIDTADRLIVSAASGWEISTKYRIGKLTGSELAAENLPRLITELGLIELPVTILHAHKAGLPPGPHRDPFDRLLIAQALAEDLPVIGADTVFDSYGVRRIW